MTCIVGVEDPSGFVVLGGDAAGVAGLDITERSDTKVFHVNDMVLGFTSSFRMGQILQYKLGPALSARDKRKSGQSAHEWLCTTFVDTARDVFKNSGYAPNLNGQEWGGVFLVGYDGKLWYVGSDFQIGHPTQGWDAVGCGEPYAKGSLESTKGMKSRKRVQLALEAAERHSGGVMRPFNIVVGGQRL